MSVYIIITDHGEMFAVSEGRLEAAKREINESSIHDVGIEVDGPYDYVELINNGISYDPQEVEDR